MILVKLQYVVTLALAVLAPLVAIGVWLAAMIGSLGRLRGKKTVVADAALQFLLVSYLLFALFLARRPVPEILLGAVLWPTVAPGYTLWASSKYFAFLCVPLLTMAVTAVLAGFLHHRFLGRWRNFWPTASVIVGFLSFLVAGELHFHSRLKQAAVSLPPVCVTSDSFLNSMRHAGADFQFDLHAEAIKAGDLYAWSFRTNNFYKVPDGARGNARTHPGSWFSLPYPPCR
jgi:hypothetical protein